jgi:MYXO-CTERM domain-containing protein
MSTVRPPRLALVMVAALATSAAARRVSACSPPPPKPTYAAILGTTPAAGATAVATNAPVVLELEVHDGPPKQVAFTVIEEDSRAPVAGTSATYAWDDIFVAWRPSAPMRAGTRHRVDVSITNDAPRPDGAHGDDHVSFTFTTSDAPVPALESAGMVSVRLETYEREDWSRCVRGPGCDTSCGCACVSTDARERLTRARVSLPSVTGGLADPGYVAVVTAAESTGDVPLRDAPTINILGTGSVTGWRGDASREVVFDLQGTSPSKPCFWLTVSDLAGSSRGFAPVCLDETAEPPRKLPLQGADGCSVAGTPGGTAAGLVLGLAAVLLARRRSRS